VVSPLRRRRSSGRWYVDGVNTGDSFNMALNTRRSTLCSTNDASLLTVNCVAYSEYSDTNRCYCSHLTHSTPASSTATVMTLRVVRAAAFHCERTESVLLPLPDTFRGVFSSFATSNGACGPQTFLHTSSAARRSENATVRRVHLWLIVRYNLHWQLSIGTEVLRK